MERGEEEMATEIKEKEKVEPKFRNPDEMTEEELTDPDYWLKRLMKQNRDYPMTCSKCHHCR